MGVMRIEAAPEACDDVAADPHRVPELQRNGRDLQGLRLRALQPADSPSDRVSTVHQSPQPTRRAPYCRTFALQYTAAVPASTEGNYVNSRACRCVRTLRSALHTATTKPIHGLLHPQKESRRVLTVTVRASSFPGPRWTRHAADWPWSLSKVGTAAARHRVLPQSTMS